MDEKKMGFFMKTFNGVWASEENQPCPTRYIFCNGNISGVQIC